jgi:WD40 repeat protein
MKKSERSTGVQITWYPANEATGEARKSAKFPAGSVITIGRDPDSDIVLHDPEVSRKHARLEIKGSEVTVTALNTKNGCRIDGRRWLGSTSWRQGQTLQIGSHLLAVEPAVGTDSIAVTLPARGSAPLVAPRTSTERDHPSVAAQPIVESRTPDAAPLVRVAISAPPNEEFETADEMPDVAAVPDGPLADQPTAGPPIAAGIAAGPPEGAVEERVPRSSETSDSLTGVSDKVPIRSAKKLHQLVDDAAPLPHQPAKPATSSPAAGQALLPPVDPETGASLEQDQRGDRAHRVRVPDRRQSRRHQRIVWSIAPVCLIGFLGIGLYWWSPWQLQNHANSSLSENAGADTTLPPISAPQLRIDAGMHAARINRIAANADCTLLTTASDDKTIRLWRLPEAKLLKTLRRPIALGNDGQFYAVAMAPDGSWIAAGGWDHSDGKSRHHGVYIFNAATGEVISRLGPFSSPITSLAVSHDGRYLAATLFNQGLRVWKRTRVRTSFKLVRLLQRKRDAERSRWQPAAEDMNYNGEPSYGVAFDQRGTLYTVAYDGRLRRYASGYGAKPETIALRGGKRPKLIAVHPSNDRVAVGFDDTTAVEIYDAATLAWRFAANTSGVRNGNFGAVAWSGDGSRLYAGGRYGDKSIVPVRFWDQGGEGQARELLGPSDTISHLITCGDGIAVAASDPAFGIFAPDGSRRVWQESLQADMHNKVFEHFAVSSNGSRIRFGLKAGSGEPVLFDLATEQLSDAPALSQDLFPADTQGLPITHWLHGTNPRFAGRFILLTQYESAHSVAVAPDKQRFVLSADWSLRAYDTASSNRAPARGWLGVNNYTNINEVTAARVGLNEARGVLTTEVLAQSPADEGGLKSGDVILSINGQNVADKDDFSRQMAEFSPNDRIDLRIRRGRDEQIISANLGAFPIIPVAWQKQVPSVPWGVNIPRDGKLVVVAYGDGTIRWHRLSDGQELLALFVHASDRRWVLWTPKGYYAASAGGEGLIGWHVNHGWNEAASFFSADRFRDRFNRPDIVKLVLSLQDEDTAIAEADRRSGLMRAEESIRTTLPPVVEIKRPQSDTPFRQREVTLEYTAHSPTGNRITAIDVLINGSILGARAPIPTSGRGEEPIRLALTLPPEDVTVTLVAREGNRASEPASIRLRWDGGSPGQATLPRLRALFVGVSNYKLESLKLSFAAKDATDLAAFFKSQQGKSYSKVEARLLADAGRADVLAGLDWLESASEDGDINLLFLAGHGVTDEKGYFYYLAAESLPESLRATAVGRDEILRTIKNRKGAMVVMLDTCQSGATVDASLSTGSPVDMNRLANELGDKTLGVFLYASALGRQFSYEHADWGNGAFTKAMIEGLSGKADRDNTGFIDTEELSLYVRRRVMDLTKRMQEPVRIKPDAAPEMEIARLTP